MCVAHFEHNLYVVASFANCAKVLYDNESDRDLSPRAMFMQQLHSHNSTPLWIEHIQPHTSRCVLGKQLMRETTVATSLRAGLCVIHKMMLVASLLSISVLSQCVQRFHSHGRHAVQSNSKWYTIKPFGSPFSLFMYRRSSRSFVVL